MKELGSKIQEFRGWW